MDTGIEWVIGLILILLRLLSFGCLIYIIIKLFQEKGIFHGLLGFFCCQLYPFIWGWLNSNTLKVLDLMVFWTFVIVLDIVFEVAIFLLMPDLFFTLAGGMGGEFNGGF